VVEETLVSQRIARLAVSVPVAPLLSLLIATQVLAHTWSAPIPLTFAGEGFGKGVLGLNSTTAVAVYVEWNGSWYDVKVKRSTNSGDSWSAPKTLSTNGYPADIAGLDPFVDVVWIQNGRVKYARSINGGVTYGPSMRISQGGFPLHAVVARGPGGLVIVAWDNGNTNAIKVRVSTDGGVTFGPPTVYATSQQDMGVSVAAGDGVVYLAYKLTTAKLRVRRSTDGGVTWSGASTVTNDGYGVVDQFDLTAQDDHAYIAYTIHNPTHPAWGAVRYRRTLNSGASWSGEMNLAPQSQKTEFPEVTLQDGVLRAVYSRRGATYGSWYRQSSNGTSWSTPEFVSAGNDPYVAYAGQIIVLYVDGTANTNVRTGT
jgi:hypothetical protein